MHRKPFRIPEKKSVFCQILRTKICVLPNSNGEKPVYSDKISMIGRSAMCSACKLHVQGVRATVLILLSAKGAAEMERRVNIGVFTVTAYKPQNFRCGAEVFDVVRPILINQTKARIFFLFLFVYFQRDANLGVPGTNRTVVHLYSRGAVVRET